MSRTFRNFVLRKQHQNLLPMSVKIYVVDDPILISFIEDNDLDGFKEYLDSDDTLMFGEPETFKTEAEALAFGSGIGHGVDEMNLAPVEQYFAEFLSVLESRKKKDGHITSEALIEADVFKEFEGQLTAELFGHESSTSGDYHAHATSDPAPRYGKENEVYETLKAEGLRIPENLIVIGTVNMDETTHQFSRKVIDRAMTIEMNIADGEAPFMSFFDDYEELAYVDNPLGKDLFLPKFVSADEALAAMAEEDHQFLKDELPSKLAALNRALNGTPFKIAYRVQNELILYFAALRADSPDVEKEKLLATAIDSILMMKVLPRIEGDVDLLKEPLKALADYTASYPQSADKVKEMADRLDRGQFTSFWP